MNKDMNPQWKLISTDQIQRVDESKGPTSVADNLQYNYSVKGRPAFSFTSLALKNDQSIVANTGTLLWMEGHVQMDTGCLHQGGPCQAFCRTCSGASCCQNKFTGPGNISLGVLLPGDLLPFEVTPNNGWIVARQSYMGGTPNLAVSARFIGLLACCCAQEGAFCTHVSVAEGAGMFFAGNYGALERREVPAGKTLWVDAGLFFAAHETCEIDIGIPGVNPLCCFCNGQGIAMKFRGPCVIYTKSRDTKRLFAFRHHHRASKAEQANARGGVR